MIVRHRVSSPVFDRSFDRTFEQLTNTFFDQRRATGPVLDASWVDDEYVLTVDLPGVPAEAISIESTGEALTLSVSTDELNWQRSLRLGGRLDAEKVSARHLDGRLTLRIGAVDKPEPRRVEIDTSPAPAAIDAGSSDADQSSDTNDAD